MEENNNELLDFTWDDENINLDTIMGEGSDFIEDYEDDEEVEEINEEIEDEEEYEEQLIEDEKPNKKDKEKEKPKKVVKKDTTIYDDVYKDLKEYGVLKHVNIEDDESLDAEKLAKLYEEDYEEEIKTRLNKWASEELDEDALAFIKFKKAGGKTSDFIESYKKLSKSGFPQGDIDDEDFQDEVIRYQLRQDEWDDDEIEDRLDSLTNNGKKDSVARKYYDRIEREVEKKRNEILQKQEQQREEAIRQEKSFKEGIESTLNELKEVNGFKITNKDKSELYRFLTDKNIKVDAERSITGFQKKLAETFQDTNKLILLAKLLNNDFNMSNFKKDIITQETKKIKSNLENRKGLTNSSFGSSTTNVRLADIFK